MGAWERYRMRVLCVLLAVACAGARPDDVEDRRSKLPYVADAVGNTLPPPANVPATVGSPVNLLTPDRYEFYTFDESGELVKRLMTLEEIQAIVAAGEETEGLVTFANENQPTIAFNFSQPPYNKVHNVVTNVQNVLKAQMEAHKNKPHTQPTLDTPDVSDSWSLILPSIFGNSGVDIIPDKTSNTFTTPDTEIKELESDDDNNLSKEGSNQIISSSPSSIQDVKIVPATEKISTVANIQVKPLSTLTTQSTTTTSTTTTSTTTAKPTTTTTTTTTPKVTTYKPNTRPQTTTVKPTTVYQFPSTSTTTTTAKPKVTTQRPRLTSTTNRPITTTIKPTTKQVRTTPKPTTARPAVTTRKTVIKPQQNTGVNFTKVQIHTVSSPVTPPKGAIQYEKISTFVPVSTATYVNEGSTRRPTTTAKPVAYASTTKRAISTTNRPTTLPAIKTNPPSTTLAPRTTTTTHRTTTTTTVKPTTSSEIPTTSKVEEKFNITTITTQSVSPTTVVTSTETAPVSENDIKVNIESNQNTAKPAESIPLFDISQSISQIASDLGNYRPIPTTNDLLLDTTRFTETNPESKESLEIDIPSDSEKISDNKSSIAVTDKPLDNFVKISTMDPHINSNQVKLNEGTKIENEIVQKLTPKIETTTDYITTTTIDPVLSESMGDLLSQVVNEAPQPTVESNKSNKSDTDITTEKIMDTTTNLDKLTTSEMPLIMEKDSTTEVTSIKVTPTEISPNKNTTDGDIKNYKKEGDKLKIDNVIPTDKTQDNKESFVQIAASKYQNASNSIKKSPANTNAVNVGNTNAGINKTVIIPKEDKPKISNRVKDSNVALNITSPIQNIKSTEEKPLKKVENKLSQTVPNKLVVPDINKLNDKTSNEKNNADKISELLPKIDEFKKKIQKVNIDEKELANERNNSWKLISTVAPPKANEIKNDKLKVDNSDSTKKIILDGSKENQGLEVTTKNLDDDVAQFTELCNELAFRYWHAMVDNIDRKRSFVLSPYSITSMLAMMFMGARGATSGEMNEILKLDDMVTFNPHFTLKNISDSMETSPVSGVLVSAFVRELFSDRNKGKILTFYKERAQHFYNGHVEEVNFDMISDIIRRRTNLLVKRYTWGKILEYMKSNTITMKPPLAAFSVNVFQTDCSDTSVEGRDGEMYFVVSPNVRQRRLVPVPAVVYKEGFLAGYDPVLDATAAAIGNSVVSTLFLMPGQQGNIVHADDLEALEKRLLESNPSTSAWKRLLRTLLPRMGLELQIPRFSHKSLFNVSSTLRQMGLKDLFDAEQADLGGLIGPSKDLYLSDMIQSTTFVTCGGGVIGDQHHIEEYPETLKEPQRRRTSRWAAGWDEPRDYQRAFHDPHDVGEAMHLPLHLRPRQARLPSRTAQPARLKFDRPFLYFVRHNPTGMILYVGRYNPRLLP